MEISLGDLFDIHSINLNLETSNGNKEAIFKELIKGITAINPDVDADELLAAIMEREKKMNTGIGSGVAIPHAYCRGLKRITGAVGISKKGIEYGGLDNKPVHVVFLLAISEKSEESHLHFLNVFFICPSRRR